MRKRFQHWFNELVIYCRLKDCGLSGETARRWGRAIGGLLGPLLYGRRNGC